MLPILTSTGTCVYVTGDGNGESEKNLGRAASREECVTMVQTQQPTWNNQHPNGATFSHYLSQNYCYAEFGMTGPRLTSTGGPSPDYETCIFKGRLKPSIQLKWKSCVITTVIAIISLSNFLFCPYTEIDTNKLDCDASNPTYIGCYTDDAQRDLQEGPMAYGYNQATCNTACKDYKYFALQDNGWCVCGDAYATEAKYVKKPDAECGSQGLGKRARSSIYHTCQEGNN